MHNVLEQIVPILIFGAWILISLYTSSQNRKKKEQRQRELERTKREEVSSTSSRSESTSRSQYDDDKNPSDMSDDLRKTLENIFGERVPEPDPIEETPPPHKQHDAEPVYRDAEAPEPQTTEAQVLQEQAALQEKYNALMALGGDVSKSDTSQSEQTTVTASATSEIDLSPSELRKGVIWAEIIAPPVSMRAS